MTEINIINRYITIILFSLTYILLIFYIISSAPPLIQIEIVNSKHESIIKLISGQIKRIHFEPKSRFTQNFGAMLGNRQSIGFAGNFAIRTYVPIIGIVEGYIIAWGEIGWRRVVWIIVR